MPYEGTLRYFQLRCREERGKLQQVDHDLSRTKHMIKRQRRHLGHIEKARWVVQRVARQTQEQLEFHINGTVSLALAAVWEDPYRFVARFVERRNKTECDMFFERDGNLMEPLEASGGGAADVAAFTLRVAFVSMEKGKVRPVLFVDEPMKFLHSSDLQFKAARMVREVSLRLGLQVIMVSAIDEFIDIADRVFEVELVGEVSHVTIRE